MQRRFFFGIILGLLVLNVAAGLYIYVARQSFVASMPPGALVQPARTPIVGRDVPPPNPLRDGGLAQPILELLPVAMLVLIVGSVALYRFQKRPSKPTDMKHPSL